MSRIIGLLLLITLLTGCDLLTVSPPAPTSTQTDSILTTEAPLSPVTIVPDTPTIAPTDREIVPATATITPESSPTAAPAATTRPQVPAAPAGEFIFQAGTPLWLMSPTHADCQAMTVGGQTFGGDGMPLKGIIVHLGGSLSGQAVSLVTTSGDAPQLGEAGYEFVLSGAPQESQDTLWLQLYDPGWQVVSGQLKFDTYAACEQNFTLVNFTWIESGGFPIYIPMIFQSAPQP